jgi:hypothetical protein
MKTYRMTRVAIPALALIAWLLLPQTAHCFYNPGTGRWLSRDPSGEEAFHREQMRNRPSKVQNILTSPPYLFVKNQPTGSIDYLGLVTMHAEMCTVTIFYGHGGPVYKWDSAGPCCAGVFIGCYDADTDGAIPVNNQIPGVPTTDDLMDRKEMTATVNTAWSAAYRLIGYKLCKKCRCACPSWTIKVVQLKTGDIIDIDVGDEHAAHPDFTYNCP